jgi:hypothetical protein
MEEAIIESDPNPWNYEAIEIPDAGPLVPDQRVRDAEP